MSDNNFDQAATARHIAWAGQWIMLALCICMLIAAPISYIFQGEGLALVQSHFGEPASTYPAINVAIFLIACGIMAGLAAIYLMQVKLLFSSSLKPTSLSRTAKNMAWLMLGMFVALYPLTHFGLVVETAFKGPTSEVTPPFWIPATLALAGSFALAFRLTSLEKEQSQ